jgi:hypothetical protein
MCGFSVLQYDRGGATKKGLHHAMPALAAWSCLAPVAALPSPRFVINKGPDAMGKCWPPRNLERDIGQFSFSASCLEVRGSWLE